MEHYLGIRVKKGLVRSPLRSDKNPTCTFYKNSHGNLIFKDFRGDFHGDCIHVVMTKFACSYYKALQIIANDFGIIKRPDLIKNETKIEYSNTEFTETSSAIISVTIKDFAKHELEWWASFGITESTLKKYRVFSCDNIYLNGNLFHLGSTKQYVFGYYDGLINDIEQWRIYFPNKRKYRFISNWKTNKIQGVKQLPKQGGETLVITKSLKDVMLFNELCINAIAPLSENQFLSESQYQKLKSKFKNIVLFFDNDLAGIKHMNKFRKMFKDLNVVFIPRKYNAKDISDFYKKYGKIKTITLINEYETYLYSKLEKDERST